MKIKIMAAEQIKLYLKVFRFQNIY